MATKQWSFWIGLVAIVIAATVFIRPMQTHSGGLLALLRSGSPHAVLSFSPCAIFVITTLAYYRFIIDYNGEIAGLSVVGLLAALFFCEQLAESDPRNWEAHVFWMYCLFFSYVTWDTLMVKYFLPPLKGKGVADKDLEEIRTLTSYINQPTLLTLFGMWFLCEYVIEHKATDSFVDGVVGFHLLFASIACVRNMRAWWK